MGEPGDDQRQRHIVKNRAIEQQTGSLKHHADMTSKNGICLFFDTAQVLTTDHHLPVGCPFYQRDQPQQR